MAPRTAPLPETIGRFRVEKLLGVGGMGEVYKAFDPTLQRTVAVKTVRPDIDRPEFLTRLYREAQACARLQHPNIVTVHEAGEIDGVVYIAMEFLKGEDLAHALKRGDLPLARKVDILMQVLDALEHAHNENVIHRDIKPSNIQCQPDGSIKLVDFGLARVTVAETLTLSGAVMGTPHYASPEQLKGQSVDKRSDIYSTGALAYELFSGRRPFQNEDDSLATMILRVISEPLPPMNVECSLMFPELETIVARAMAKSPDDRFQSAMEMRSALANFRASAQAQSTILSDGPLPVSLPASTADTRSVPTIPVADDSQGPPRNTWVIGGAAAAVVALGVVLLLFRSGASAPANTAPNAVATSASGTASNLVADASPTAAGSRVDAPAPAAAPGKATIAPAEKSLQGSRRETAPTEAAAPIVTPPESRGPLAGAMQMFYGGGPAAAMGTATSAPSATKTGLAYRLIQQGAPGIELDVDPSTAFHSGDRVRFAFQSNMDGFLYVAQQGSSGKWTVLFPHPAINGGKNAIQKLEQYDVPPTGWFRFDATPGVEHLFVFLSKEPLAQLPGFDKPVTKTETLMASVVDDLQKMIRPRDLVFEKETTDHPAPGGGKTSQATYVVNRDEVGKAVAATIQLTHGE